MYCSEYVSADETPSTGTFTLNPFKAAAPAVLRTAPCAAVPGTITVLTPLSLRICSKSVPRNLLAPDLHAEDGGARGSADGQRYAACEMACLTGSSGRHASRGRLPTQSWMPNRDSSQAVAK